MELIKKEEKAVSVFLTNEILQLGVLFLVIFAIPFFFKSPQYIIGTIVNFLLIVSFSKFGLKKMFPALFLPSFATYLSGTIFGGATNFLLYIIPFIILSNLIYVFLFERIKVKGLNIFISSGTKAIFLFTSAFILHKTIGLPAIFLTTMGVTQLITAVSGGTLAYFFLNDKKKR